MRGIVYGQQGLYDLQGGEVSHGFLSEARKVRSMLQDL